MTVVRFDVWVLQAGICGCGHEKSDHKPEIGFRQTFQGMLEKVLHDINFGWLYADKTEAQAEAYAMSITRVVRGFVQRLAVYRLMCHRYR